MPDDISASIKTKLLQIDNYLQSELLSKMSIQTEQMSIQTEQMSIQTEQINKLIRGLAITINKQNMILERLDDIETKIEEASKERE